MLSLLTGQWKGRDGAGKARGSTSSPSVSWTLFRDRIVWTCICGLPRAACRLLVFVSAMVDARRAAMRFAAFQGSDHGQPV